MVSPASLDSLPNQAQNILFLELCPATPGSQEFTPHTSLICVPDRLKASGSFARLYPMNLLTWRIAQAAGLSMENGMYTKP